MLPNGDRLAYTAGGVLVQSQYSGIYSGTLTVDLLADQLQTACAGGANLIVDPYGELVMGTANCFLSFQGFDIDGEYLLNVENDRGDLAGEISVDLAGLFELPLAFDGGREVEGKVKLPKLLVYDDSGHDRHSTRRSEGLVITCGEIDLRIESHTQSRRLRRQKRIFRAELQVSNRGAGEVVAVELCGVGEIDRQVEAKLQIVEKSNGDESVQDKLILHDGNCLVGVLDVEHQWVIGKVDMVRRWIL